MVSLTREQLDQLNNSQGGFRTKERKEVRISRPDGPKTHAAILIRGRLYTLLYDDGELELWKDTATPITAEEFEKLSNVADFQTYDDGETYGREFFRKFEFVDLETGKNVDLPPMPRKPTGPSPALNEGRTRTGRVRVAGDLPNA